MAATSGLRDSATALGLALSRDQSYKTFWGLIEPVFGLAKFADGDTGQCDQIGRLWAIWATFESQLWFLIMWGIMECLLLKQLFFIFSYKCAALKDCLLYAFLGLRCWALSIWAKIGVLGQSNCFGHFYHANGQMFSNHLVTLYRPQCRHLRLLWRSENLNSYNFCYEKARSHVRF